MGLFDSLFGNPAEDAARKNRKMLTGLKKEGMGYIDAGQDESRGYIEGVGDIYSGLADRSLANLDFYKDALGLNGAGGSAAALERFQTGPGYEFQMSQGLDALERRAAARGQLNSGNTNIDTLTYSQGLANQEWGNWLDRLQGFDSQQNQNYLAGLSGQAGSLSDLASLSQRGVDQRLNLSSEIVNGLMAANNASAQGSANNTSSGLGLIGSFLGYL